MTAMAQPMKVFLHSKFTSALFSSSTKPINPFHTGGMDVGAAYRQIENAKRLYGQEAVEELKRQAMAQYRIKNMALGGGLMAFGAAIYAYSVWKTKKEDI